MVCYRFALIVALAAGTVAAQDGDLTASAECRQARAALHARTALDPQRESLRRHAARVCLGGDGNAPPRSARSAVPPVAVTTIPRASPVIPPSLTVGPNPPLSPPVRQPAVLTGCDVAGCWTSDGSRLTRAGPNLLGPRGVCTVHGVALHCP